MKKEVKVSIPQAVWIACNIRKNLMFPPIERFQYRKRYGLHATEYYLTDESPATCFNTASGMDCMQRKYLSRNMG